MLSVEVYTQRPHVKIAGILSTIKCFSDLFSIVKKLRSYFFLKGKKENVKERIIDVGRVFLILNKLDE